jgi:hypothetical protein
VRSFLDLNESRKETTADCWQLSARCIKPILTVAFRHNRRNENVGNSLAFQWLIDKSVFLVYTIYYDSFS